MMKFVALALVLSAANAACPNKCSGHGDCTVHDVCVCYQDWQSGDEAGGDCSDRTCPFDIAWADVPSDEDVAHGYAECSAKGICNRKTGMCECFDGYTGKACRRTTCPNDCSGHGTCEYIADVNPDRFDGAATNSHYNFGNDLEHDLLGDIWDSKKTRMCVCDPKWTDVDCSRRMCPKGNDILDRNLLGSDNHCDETYETEQVQQVCFNAASVDQTGELALVFRDLYGNKYTTTPLTVASAVSEVQSALRSLPDRTLETVTVSDVGSACETTLSGAETLGWAVTFTGSQVSGNQNLLDVLVDECLDGCQPKRTGLDSATTYEVIETTSSLSDAYECGRRGKCDYSTGICECFSGFTDEDCSTQSALA